MSQFNISSSSIADCFHSTVFPCDTTSDNRYIRCDFKQCSSHALNKESHMIPVDYWMLNTEKNVANLERHVSDEIYKFVNSHEDDVAPWRKEDYELNTSFLTKPFSSYKDCQRILVIFNLRDPQSSLGKWLNLFLCAVKHGDNVPTNYICITLSFSSRKELLLQVEKLHSLSSKRNRFEVMVILSCHSSSQGQVFSCTPSVISKHYQFEEFCSVHDFVCACQNAIKDKLKVIHISSCFAMKLNISHKEWPVNYDWYKTNLNCILSGSAKEIYESGSQTADLFLVLNTVLSPVDIRRQFLSIFHDASIHLFPDLILEMGLCVADPFFVDSMMENPDKEDRITRGKIVDSNIHLVLISCGGNHNNSLKEALLCNLQNRMSSDFRSDISIIDITYRSREFAFKQLSDGMKCLASTSKKVFFIILGLVVGVVPMARVISSYCQTLPLDVYGIHFNSIESSKVRKLEKNILSISFPMTAFVDWSGTSMIDYCPVLLYIIHLSLGENGIALMEKSVSWSLEDVYNEVTYVLPGLCKKCNLTLFPNQIEIHQPVKEYVPTPLIPAVTQQAFCSPDKDFLEKKDSESSSSRNKVEQESNLENNASSLPKKKQLKPEFIGVSTEYGRCGGGNSNKQVMVGENNIFDIFQKDLDVPQMANVDEVLIYHYVLELDVSFEDKCLDGNILLFVQPTIEETISKEFQMCLDSTLIDIEAVQEICLPPDFQIHFHSKTCCSIQNGSTNTLESDLCKSCCFIRNYKEHLTSDLKYQRLPYEVQGWCIRIWKESFEWPKCVHIKYRTKPVGPSLMWCDDEDGNPCCFTPGAYINNRSMMPCQEPPVAMSTWQARVKVPEGFVVLSSGDEVTCQQCLLPTKATCVFQFEMMIPLPSSTLAFAIGKFVRSYRVVPVSCSPNKDVVYVSLYAPQSKINRFEDEYLELAAKYFKSACDLLGEYPFTRTDFVIMPRSFACLGLQSPNLTFLSQSVLCGDQSMSTRIAHELSHAWFGLLVGTSDWTEEWLSEGFATYIEDRIIANADKMADHHFLEYSQLLQVIRFKTLKAEIDHALDDNLKLLRPKRSGNHCSAIDAVKKSMANNKPDMPGMCSVIPYSAISSKKWSQVHYLKGYFLLMHMAKMVGFGSFDAFLKYYLNVYRGKLVTSEMFFNLFLKHFSFPTSLKDEFATQWMESTALPEVIDQTLMMNNTLISLVNAETRFWKSNDVSNKRCKSLGFRRNRNYFVNRQLLNSYQLVLLLENMIEVDYLTPSTLTQMNRIYNFDSRNAEVRHRWCELIIKHLYSLRYDHVKRFLINDQGMGIYLFGELMISCNKKQNSIAKEIFEIIKDEMDRSTYITVREIIYGIDETSDVGNKE